MYIQKCMYVLCHDILYVWIIWAIPPNQYQLLFATLSILKHYHLFPFL